jgi:hypothetical protein
MWLVLSEEKDGAALWAYQGLKDRGLYPLKRITPESLTLGVQWEHYLGEKGQHIQITLADGCQISHEMVQGVINRLVSVPFGWQGLTHQDDREYAIQELTAFYMSWLYTLPCQVLNRPAPQGLCGPWRHLSEWLYLAAQAGLPIPPYRQSSENAKVEAEWLMRLTTSVFSRFTVFVVGERVIGVPIAPQLQLGCRHLAKLSGTLLLGVDFATTATGDWVFAGATPLPDLRQGGEALLDVLFEILQNERS